MNFPPRRSTFVGIGLMLLSASLFSLDDAIGKLLVKGYPVGEHMPKGSKNDLHQRSCEDRIPFRISARVTKKLRDAILFRQGI